MKNNIFQLSEKSRTSTAKYAPLLERLCQREGADALSCSASKKQSSDPDTPYARRFFGAAAPGPDGREYLPFPSCCAASTLMGVSSMNTHSLCTAQTSAKRFDRFEDLASKAPPVQKSMLHPSGGWPLCEPNTKELARGIGQQIKLVAPLLFELPHQFQHTTNWNKRLIPSSIRSCATACSGSGRRGRMRCSAPASSSVPRSSMTHSTERNTCSSSIFRCSSVGHSGKGTAPGQSGSARLPISNTIFLIMAVSSGHQRISKYFTPSIRLTIFRICS